METNIWYWDTNPVIFWFTDNFPLKYYGLLFMAGIMLGYLVVKAIYKKEGIPTKDLDTLLTYIIIGTLVGARLGHCLFYEPAYYLQHPIEIFLPIQKINGSYTFTGYQGLASHGGGIGVIIAIFIYTRKYKAKLLWILDKVAISVPLAGVFIRLGNFMNSEIYGKPTNGDWGIIFMRDDLVPRHPTQLYESSSYLLIFIVLYLLYAKKGKIIGNGFIFGLFLVLLFSVRFIIEFFKENQVGFEDNLALNMGQILSIPFIIIGIILAILKKKKNHFKSALS